MPLAISAAALLVGATLLLASVLVVTTDRPEERFPLWSNPKHRRGASLGLRMAGVVFVILPSIMTFSSFEGPWVALPLAAAFAPGALAIVLHNSAVSRRANSGSR